MPPGEFLDKLYMEIILYLASQNSLVSTDQALNSAPTAKVRRREAGGHDLAFPFRILFDPSYKCMQSLV
jgi:hypothetical protein